MIASPLHLGGSYVVARFGGLLDGLAGRSLPASCPDARPAGSNAGIAIADPRTDPITGKLAFGASGHAIVRRPSPVSE